VAVERLDFQGEDVVVQHGPSPIRPPAAACFEFLPFERLNDLVASARVVVAHAGVGSILVCASHGHVPIVIPRLARYGEVVDDHQLNLARRLDAAGTVICVEDLDDLPGLVAPSPLRAPSASRMAGPLLAEDLRQYVDAVLG
jgi:UDP-N-acetylglucosamine transferase subunit ALG13